MAGYHLDNQDMRFNMTELNISTVFDMDHEPDLYLREQKYLYNYNQFVELQQNY